MHERKRQQHGDMAGRSRGDFPDWNNPEDREEAPADYYGQEDDFEDEDSYVPGPDDPDYDLSEAAGYAGREAPHRRSLLPRWLVVVASLLLILALLTPLLIRIS
jgi:hypothetical protein